MPHAAFKFLSFLLGMSTIQPLTWSQEFATQENRLQQEYPTSTNFFVETEKGYMVPYEITLPGTNIKCQMMPVPGTKSTINPDGFAPFWMGRFEVTWAEYANYMLMNKAFRIQKRDKGQASPLKPFESLVALSAPTEIYDPSWRFQYAQSKKSPALSMTQFASRQYTQWLSTLANQFYRLPTASEWMHACRAGAKSDWELSASRLKAYAVFGAADDSGPQDVGSKRPNPLGLYDMQGNVAEWVIEDERLLGPLPKVGDEWNKENDYRWLAYGGSWLGSANECQASSAIICDDGAWEMDPNAPFSPFWHADSEFTISVGFRVLSPLADATEEEKLRAWKPDTPTLMQDLRSRSGEGRGAYGYFDVQKIGWVQELIKQDKLRPLKPWN